MILIEMIEIFNDMITRWYIIYLMKEYDQNNFFIRSASKFL